MFPEITERVDGINSKEIQKEKFMVYICETAANVSRGIWFENQI